MILITWWGLPQYAARAIGAFVRETSERVYVVSTPPAVPVKGMDELIGCPIIWVSDEKSQSPTEGTKLLTELGAIPRVVVVGNWNLPMYRVIENRVRSDGGKVIAVSDANFRMGVMQILRAIRFRLFLKRRFNYFFVPGKSGRRLMRFYGVPDERVFEGLYAADQNLFRDTRSILDRTKKIIYVGQFIKRKNVLCIALAFIKSGISAQGWSLEMCGSGPLKKELLDLVSSRQSSSTNIIVRDFVQPEELATKYQEARCFILASLEEHWGVVVHEAALSGCYMLLSKGIGASDDFATGENARIFDPSSIDEISETMRHVATMDDEAMLKAEQISFRLGLEAGTQKFVKAMNEMVR